MTAAINTAIQLAVPALLLLVPLCFYRRKGKRFIRFYIAMATGPKRRKAYMLALSMIVVLFNFSCFAREGASLWQVPGFIIGLLLLRYKSTDAALHLLNSDRMLQELVFGTILLSMMEPRLFSLSVSMALVFAFAMMYPSDEIIRQASFMGAENMSLQLSHEEIVDLYFTMPRARIVRHSQTHKCEAENGTDQPEKNQKE